ncbi:GIN domain-containing protein [Arcticibacter sp.]|uniref:GIN domain-containing protein n=1 Tax=Arcticibacter sp. TaxID=1872630 RepID=UPI00388EBF99
MKTNLLKTGLTAGFLMIIAFILSSCNGERLVADNNVISEVRDVSGFERVEAGGANNVHIVYGQSFKVELKGSSNLVQAYETKVDNKTLILRYRDDVHVDDDDVEVFVTLPLLNGVTLSGSGDIDIRGEFPEAKKFIVNIDGSGDINISESFTCISLEADISGSGKAELTNLETVRSTIVISGSGDAYVHAEEELDVRINGSGTVYYKGSPRVKSDINGSGQVKRL